MRLPIVLFVSLAVPACAGLELEEAEPYAWVVYDPSGGSVPVPNDLLRDADAGRLNLPLSGDLPAAELAFREALNTQDAWPTTFPARARFSEPVDPASLDAIAVWEWGAPPRRVDVTLELAADGLSVTVLPPEAGWAAGGRYAVAVRGGEDGLRTVRGREVGPDAAMWFLRAEEPLDDPRHQRAFPGATREERLAAAARLEGTRQALAPWVDVVGWSRDELAALWTFSVTQRVELAMDRASQRVPLPFDLLINPATGLVELTADPEDSALEAEAKLVASTLRGFGLSADPYFETTRGLDPATVTPDSVQLWDVTATPVRVPTRVRLLAESGDARCQAPPVDPDCRFVFVVLPPDRIPLDPATTYAVVVTRDVRDLAGQPIAPMPLGTLLTNPHPLVAEGVSQVSSLDDESAARLEGVRTKVGLLLDTLGRENVVTAWPFTTMDPLPDLQVSANWAERNGWAPEPKVRWRRPASSLFEEDAIGDLFPGAVNPGPALYLGRTANVKQVVAGTIDGADFLHDVTRRWKTPHDVEPIEFWAVVPEGQPAGKPLPVVIFGHAIVTDRRFLLMIASELADRGYVAVSIDWPYHGERVACVNTSLVAVPNFFPEALQPLVGFEDPLIWLPPCESGDAATCALTGECLDARGRIEPFSSFPILDMKPVSGAAFLDTSDLPHIPDHVHQALVDASTLVSSLRTGAWDQALGQRIDPDRISFVGQSLGSIIGSVWVASRDDIDRAVFNVPGSNLVDLFRTSTYFKPQIDEYFRSLELEDGTFEQQRLIQVASWLIDTVDPHSVAYVYRDRAFEGLIQMDKVDADNGDLIIPNATTENLARVSGLPVIAYPSILHADLIVPLLGDQQLSDLGDFLGTP